MMKILFFLMLVICSSAYAQQDVYFYKKNGDLLAGIDSADYIRVVSKPDSGSNLFNVTDYYTNRKIKQVGKSTSPVSVIYDGIVISYFRNGKRKSIINYDKGTLKDSAFYFFSNGQHYMSAYYSTDKQVKKRFEPIPALCIIDNQYDSTGKATIIKGRGTYTGYNEDFTHPTEAGLIENGRRTGTWKGIALEGKLSFTENYLNGELQNGIATDNEGHHYTYAKGRETQPNYLGGLEKFYNYLAQNVRYPAHARENHIQGRVILRFKISSAGQPGPIGVISSAGPDLDNETIRVVSTMQNWVPAQVCGYKIDSYFTIPVAYTLPND